MNRKCKKLPFCIFRLYITHKKEGYMQTPTSSYNVSDSIIEMAQERLAYLRELLPHVEKTKNVSGNLRVDKCKRSFQYYIITTPGDTKGTYLPRKDIRKAKAIAQRDYNAAAATILKRDIAAINNFLAAFHPEALDNAFTGMNHGRRAHVAHVRESDEESINRWRHIQYSGKP